MSASFHPSYPSLYVVSLVALLATVPCVGAGTGGASAGAGSNVVAAAVEQTRRDVVTASAALNEARTAITAKRIPLAQQRDALEAEVRGLRRDVARLQESRARRDQERETLENAVREQDSELTLALAALQEYRRSLETRMGPAEPGWLRERMAATDAALAAHDDYAGLPAVAGDLLDVAGRWNWNALGGETFPGTCLDPAGREHAGQFVVLGPLSYFAAADGAAAGLVGRQVGSLSPSIQDLGGRGIGDVAAVAQGGEAELLVDPSGGHAVRLKEAREPLWRRLRAGGAIVVPLTAVGLLALALTLAKLVAFRRVHPPTPEQLDPMFACLARGDTAGARAAVASIGAPFAEILLDGIEHHTASTENLEEILHERVLGILPTLDRHLGMLAVLGGVSPLLGLLGTVGGMIHTFQVIAVFGLGDTHLLSGGIAEAMITTQLGLAIAIPVVLIHAYLSRRLRTIVAALEQTVAAFVNRVAASGGGSAPP